MVVFKGDVIHEGTTTPAEDHVCINTKRADKNVRLNSQTFTTDANIVAVQAKPRAGINLTNNVTGIETEPGINSGYASTKSIIGVKATPYLRGNGNVGGEMVGFQAELGTPSGYTGTVTGPVAALRVKNSCHGTITNGVFIIHAETHEGNKVWDGLASLPDDGQIAKYNEDKTGGTKGWIKVKIGGYTGYINVATLA